MTDSPKLERLAALSESDLDTLGLLSGDVFEIDSIDLEWKRKTDHFLLRDGKRPICRVGVIDGVSAFAGEETVTIAGIGGVVTVPDKQGEGHARRLLDHALLELARESASTFAMLFCLDRLVPYYAKQGWMLLKKQRVRVLQTSGYIESPLRCMVYSLRDDVTWPRGDVTIEERIW